ncbi:hypothetical protein I4U23_012895 [Adineta vaga]|nr:hypothetical protein I4U23_012895 [Adineta vaga]
MSSSIKSSLTLPLESKISDVYPLIVLLRPDWSLINIHLCRLTGGISNVAFVVSNDFDQSDTFVIKIYGLKTEEFIDHNAG